MTDLHLSSDMTVLLRELPAIRHLPDDGPRGSAWLERKRDLLARLEAEQHPAGGER